MDRKLVSIILAGLLGAAPGCIIVHDEPADGTLTVRWSIEGTTDPAACGWHRVAWTQIVISAPDGAVEASLSPACSVFATSVGLYPGSHRLAVTMLDSYGRAVSTTVVAPVDVWMDHTSTVITEFPATSFYQ